VDHPGDREQPAPACRQPGRFQIDAPENAAKLDAVESLAQLAEQAGLSLIHLALAFVLEHPAVTAPIIGTRTYEQLEGQLDAAQVRLSPDVLDEIDKIVPPGTTLSARDQAYRPPALTDPARRRRG
jgi:aryl-alcohol dehydrogenase-like predicted oxidoreductase